MKYRLPNVCFWSKTDINDESTVLFTHRNKNTKWEAKYACLAHKDSK